MMDKAWRQGLSPGGGFVVLISTLDIDSKHDSAQPSVCLK